MSLLMIFVKKGPFFIKETDLIDIMLFIRNDWRNLGVMDS